MPQFTVCNDRSAPMDVVIEPWAHVETLSPTTVAVFDYDEPADVSISAEDNGDLLVWIGSERIRWIANGHEKQFGAP